MKATKVSVFIIDLALSHSPEDVIGHMKSAKIAWESGLYQHVFCTIGGFGNDSRELWQIPEVRAFCRRLVDSAFVSYLSMSGQKAVGAPDGCDGLWGALEVWMVAENLMGYEYDITKDVLEQFQAMLVASNKKADKIVGEPKFKK